MLTTARPATWFDKPATRPAYRSFPHGRDYRCGCGHTVRPEGSADAGTPCGECGGELSRVVADFNVVQEPA